MMIPPGNSYFFSSPSLRNHHFVQIWRLPSVSGSDISLQVQVCSFEGSVIDPKMCHWHPQPAPSKEDLVFQLRKDVMVPKSVTEQDCG